jgi:uncharacterized RDD family membrane protein YckC
MKCPKCDYLGFETGDRCRNCGYDFTLLVSADELPDLELHRSDEASPVADAMLRDLDRAPAPAAVSAPALPLFTSTVEGDDEPLIKLPAAPRAPLAVRRTPETPRLRTMARAVRKPPDPSFEFGEEPPQAAAVTSNGTARVAPGAVPALPAVSGVARRLAAVAVDHAILVGIDLTVVYFTLKIATLTLADWRQLSIVPLLVFLLFLKFAYFAAFTAVGGQTIGKMGSGIRVVADDGSLLDISRALQRSLAGAISLATLGAAFAPALLGPDGRALPDRLARTRVVCL